MVVSLRPGMEKDRDEVIAKLIEIQYERNEMNFVRNKFRVRGDVLDIFPSDSSSLAVRVEFFGDEVERICDFNPVTGEMVAERKHVAITRRRTTSPRRKSGKRRLKASKKSWPRS